MKLTERDKKLLIGLGIFIFVVVFAKFIFMPKIADIKVLNQEIEQLNNTYAVNATYKAKAENIDSDIKVLSAKLTDLRSVYPPQIDISELIVTIKNLSKVSKFEFNTIGFDNYKAVDNKEENSDSQAETSSGTETKNNTSNDSNNKLDAQSEANSLAIAKIEKYFYLWGLKSQSKNNDDKINVADGKSYSITVKVEGEGTNEQFKAFLTSLNKLGTKAYCNSISITGAASGKSEDTNNKLKLSATITFYGILDRATGGYYLLPDGKWSPIAPADNKTNLFKEYSGFNTISSAGSSSGTSDTSIDGNKNDDESNSNECDFAVVASAYGGGYAPSVSISCQNPEPNSTLSRPVVYGDSKGIENAEIFIEEKDGRLFCKFKTDYESYPDTEYSKTFEFIPNDKDLKLIILSSKRFSDDDKAGVNLNIINNTKRTFKYVIKYDDEKSPRVKIGKTVGSVINEK